MEEQNGIPLLELETAYQSLRESGFDFSTAIGELIDNSVQAKASRIDIIPKIEEIENGRKREPISIITQVVVVDNGDGMDAKTLNKCPQLGFSTRYNDREGLGRFGVGATYASISQCIRTTFCSRSKGTDDFLATYIDLEEIANKAQINIPIPSKDHLPENIEGISIDDSSTIVIWNKCDRLKSDPNGKPIKASELLEELKRWISRAYRHTIWNGVEIYINCEKVLAYDPLYSNTENTEFPDDLSAIEWFSDTLDWPIPNSPDETSPISVKLTLLPETWRTKQGDGGSDFAKERRITENQGISVLRRHREVAFGNFYPMVPGQRPIDRFWGCEINFEPVLDECWKVKNVKRGARPTEELRSELRKLLSAPIGQMRKKIQEFWRIGISRDIVDEVHKTAAALMENNDNASAQEIKSRLSRTNISIEDISRILEDLAVENNWDWTTDGTHRSYSPLSSQQLTKLESERKTCFESIRTAIEDSSIDKRFKDVALYDLDQAKISYERMAFKASIVMFGAIAEGLMLGVIRTDSILKPMIADPKNAPKRIQRLNLGQFSQPEDLANKISDKLNFEDYKNIIAELKPDIEKLEVQRIQNLRNTIHPWKAIKQPQTFRDPGPTIAINCLSSLALLADNILV